MCLELIKTRENNKLYRSDNSLIKVFNPEYSKQDVFTEALITSKVECLGLNVPSIKEVYMKDGCWTFNMDLIGGKCMADLMTENPDNIDHYLNIFVDIQTKIHKKTCDSITTLRNQLYDRINASNLEDYQKYDILAVLDSAPKHKKLCHGNLNPTHIWLDGDNAYILDWNHATQGNASADVARTYLWFSLYDPDFAEKYINLFCEKTNTTKQYVRQWLPIVAAARLTKDIPEESELLHKWVSQCDYQ